MRTAAKWRNFDSEMEKVNDAIFLRQNIFWIANGEQIPKITNVWTYKIMLLITKPRLKGVFSTRKSTIGLYLKQ